MRTLLVCMLMVTGVATAATPKVTTDYDPHTQFTAYKTYHWALKPDGGSPLMQQRIVEGIDAQLIAKGWTRAAQGDVAIAAHISTAQKQSLDTFYTGTGMGGWGWRRGLGGGMLAGSATTQVESYEVGTLVVDLFDSRTQQAIWRGTATGTVAGSPQKQDAEVDKALAKMFTNFPPDTIAKP